MRNRLILAWLFLATAGALRAEQPAHDPLTGKLYLLKSDAAFASRLPIPRQGVFAYDVNTRKFTKFASFGFITTTYFGNQVALGATADRFIVQGTDYFEYDLVTGRLLRRYPGIAIPAMRFRGTVVTEEQTAALGIPAGVYGFFVAALQRSIKGFVPARHSRNYRVVTLARLFSTDCFTGARLLR